MITAADKITLARTVLLFDHPFFGALALRLNIVEDPQCDTAWTDGTSLGYNPTFVDSLKHKELVALIAHEVMHCASGHPWRRDARDHENWNVAADFAINAVLTESGFQLPAGALLDPQFSGNSAEWIYDRLPQPLKIPAGGKFQSAQGEVRDAPDPTKPDVQTEEDWKQATQQAAAAAKARGELHGEAKRFASEAVKPVVDWRSALRRFVQEIAAADYSWQRPNVRYLASGLFLPSLRSEQMGSVAVVIDTSGSIDQVTLNQFASELQSIADEVKPRSVDVVYCDARVHRVDSFERDDKITLNPVGGGGTDFRPAFEAIEKFDEPPRAIVFLTDLYGAFPASAPEIPVLWASISKLEAPFGETIHLR